LGIYYVCVCVANKGAKGVCLGTAHRGCMVLVSHEVGLHN
jgi:hypothetical protein